MSEAFDPYHRWLGIHSKDQPPHHYRLLGIDLFEGDPEVIRDATERQMAHVRKYQLGPHSEISQKILNELAAAKACLLDRDKKAGYDTAIKAKLSAIKSSTEQYDTSSLLTPQVPLPLPPIAKEHLLPSKHAAGTCKNTKLTRKNGSGRHDKKWLHYISFGTFVLLVSIFMTIFMMQGNNQNLATSQSSNRIAADTDQVEKNPLNQHARDKMLRDDKEVEQITDQALPNILPTDDHTIRAYNHAATAEDSSKDLTSTVKKELKPVLDKEPKDQLSSLTPTSSTTKSKGGLKVKLGSPSRFADSKIMLNLPSGKTFNSQLFDVDLKTVENNLEDQLKQQEKDEVINGKVILLHSQNGKAWAEQDKGKLDGVYLALYRDKIPVIYANYIDGSRNDIIYQWNENGERLYWCQNAKGFRHGFCCYFKDDILRILLEVNLNKITAVYLCHNSELEKSFESLEQAVADVETKMFLDEMNETESELKALETKYKKQVKEEESRRRQKIVSISNQEKRNDIQMNSNKRALDSQKGLEAIKRRHGF